MGWLHPTCWFWKSPLLVAMKWILYRCVCSTQIRRPLVGTSLEERGGDKDVYSEASWPSTHSTVRHYSKSADGARIPGSHRRGMTWSSFTPFRHACPSCVVVRCR